MDLARCVAAARRAISEHLARTGIAARVEPAPKMPAFTRVVYPLPSKPPLVSVIVQPERGPISSVVVLTVYLSVQTTHDWSS